AENACWGSAGRRPLLLGAGLAATVLVLIGSELACRRLSRLRLTGEVHGYSDEYGIPRNLEDAQAFIAQTDAESIALLDLRVFNTAEPHALGPFDHGLGLASKQEPLNFGDARIVALLEPSAVLTLRLCTTFIYIGVAKLGIPIAKLAVTASDPSER
ncbi:unnamed protein product, partial [Symbiodinium microadriaticum]